MHSRTFEWPPASRAASTNLPRPVESLGPTEPRHVQNLKAVVIAQTERVAIKVNDPKGHEAPAILHYPEKQDIAEGAVILLSGAGGGVSGPAGMYPSLATKLASVLSLPTVRLDYRTPADNTSCVADVRSCMDYLANRFSSRRFVLIGWSFGGAPAFTVAAANRDKIAGVATVASQTAQTAGIARLAAANMPVLLLHGTGDKVLSSRCAEDLFDRYGPGGDRTLKLFPGDDHGLVKNAPEVEKLLFEFAGRCLGKQLGPEEEEAAASSLTGNEKDRIQTMEEGKDLEGEKL